jgi:hypothetical protein
MEHAHGGVEETLRHWRMKCGSATRAGPGGEAPGRAWKSAYVVTAGAKPIQDRSRRPVAGTKQAAVPTAEDGYGTEKCGRIQRCHTEQLAGEKTREARSGGGASQHADHDRPEALRITERRPAERPEATFLALFVERSEAAFCVGAGFPCSRVLLTSPGFLADFERLRRPRPSLLPEPS